VSVMFKAVSSSGGTVTAATADLVVPANSVMQLGVGSNGFIAYAAIGSTGSVQISEGSGLFSGAGGGGSAGSSVSADTNLTPTGPISAANNFSSGLQVQNWQNGRVTLTGAPTSGSVLAFAGFTGWNAGVLECTGAGTQGTNQFEVDVTGPTGGTLWRRVASFTGPTASIAVNLAGQTFLNVVADVWSAGAPTCVLRGSANMSVPDDYAVPTQADLSAPISFNAAATALVLPAVAGEGIVVTSWFAIAAGTTNLTWEYGTQTTNPCDTGTTALTGALPLIAQAGGAPGSGLGITLNVPPGNQLCAINSAAIQVSGSLAYARR